MILSSFTPATGIVSVKRSIWSVAPHLLLASLVGLLGLYLSFTTSAFDASIGVPELDVQLPVFLLLFLFLVIRPLVLLVDTRGEISMHHLRFSIGIYSFRRRDLTIPFEDLRGVRVDQTILDRILGVGTLIAWTHSATNPEIRIHGVGRPREVANLISDRIDSALVHMKRDHS